MIDFLVIFVIKLAASFFRRLSDGARSFSALKLLHFLSVFLHSILKLLKYKNPKLDLEKLLWITHDFLHFG